MKLVALSLLGFGADAAKVLMTNSAMSGGFGKGWNTTVWSVDTVTGGSQLVADTFDDRAAWTATVCNNVYYSVWADITVGFGLRALDLATGESKDLPTTSRFHVIACDPKDNSKLLGTASDPASVQDAYRYSRRTSREDGVGAGDEPNPLPPHILPFHLKSYDPATNTEAVVGTFPADEVKWGGYDGIFSFSQDGSEVWASWPADDCPLCSDAKLGGHVHIMDTTSGKIKTSTDITFDGRKKGTPYFMLPDAKRGVFILDHDSKRNLKWADLEVSGSSIKATLSSTDATQLFDGAGVVQMCGDNVILFEKGSARYGGAIVDEISPADGAIINSVDLLATLDIEGQDQTSISAVACLTPSSSEKLTVV